MTEEKKEKRTAEDKPLGKMTVKELRTMAMDIPHTTSVHDLKKEELITFIQEAKGIKSKEPEKKIKDRSKLITKQEIKVRIRLLKNEKTAAQENHEPQRVHFLRNRINRLKKQTRRMS